MQSTPTMERADLTDLEFWLLVEPGEASEVHWWQHTCWSCSAGIVVWWCRTTPPWSASRPEEDPLVIAAVLADCNNVPPMAYLEWRTTRPRPNGYMGFCCPHCHRISGDYFLYKEFIVFSVAGLTNIVSVSI